MIIFSLLVRGNPPSSLLVEGSGVVPEVSVFERSREDWPISQCSVKSAFGEEEPGFVVPKAQMMFSVVDAN